MGAFLDLSPTTHMCFVMRGRELDRHKKETRQNCYSNSAVVRRVLSTLSRRTSGRE